MDVHRRRHAFTALRQGTDTSSTARREAMRTMRTVMDERRGRTTMDRNPRIEELKRRLASRDYVVDEAAVATAIVRRMHRQATGPSARPGATLAQMK
jgi:anti-sigma28 factor (negative regulator of flagellin synthesis)